jgi:hypothetical protein
LRYPRQFLGRKNPHKDPQLRGKADYIFERAKQVAVGYRSKAAGHCHWH